MAYSFRIFQKPTRVSPAPPPRALTKSRALRRRLLDERLQRLLLVLLVVLAYNRLVRLRNRTENAWAQVDVQLRKRYDLVPNLVETVKGYAAHEQQTFERVIADFLLLYDVEPCLIAHDLHPDYMSTQWARGVTRTSSDGGTPSDGSRIRPLGLQSNDSRIPSADARR